jgi:hypothetical protein
VDGGNSGKEGEEGEGYIQGKKRWLSNLLTVDMGIIEGITAVSPEVFDRYQSESECRKLS